MKLKKFLLPKHKTDLARIGGENDGGYPMSIKVLKKTNYLFSIGLGEDWTFEEAASNINSNLEIFMFDAQINQKNWFKKIIKEMIYFLFLKSSIKKIISIVVLYFKYLYFFNRKKINHVKKNIVNSSEVIINEKNEQKFEEIFNLRNKKNIILKIDIEGNEYRVLDEIINNQNVIEFLIIEFHEIDLMEIHIKKFVKRFKLDLVHVHINNFGGKNKNGYGRVIEAMFSKRKYNQKRKKIDNKFPNNFYDQPNNKNQNDEKIVFK
jgi:hypothetical protein